MKPLWIIGSGGHAKVAIDTARSTGKFEVMGCLDDNPDRAGELVLDAPLFGPVAVESIVEFDIEYSIIVIGSNPARRAIANRLAERIEWTTVVHSRAFVSNRATLGAGTLVCASAVVQPGSRIGDHVIGNTSASIDHDCTIGDFVHVGPGCHVAGDVAIGEGAFIGIGSSIVPGCTIGEWAVICAGAVVTGHVLDNSTTVGVPAKTIKQRKSGWHLD